MEIIPLVGLDNLEFGLVSDIVSGMLGNPDDTEVIEADEEGPETLVWYYFDAGFTFFFEGDDEKILNCIETDNEECILFGKKIFELNEANIIELMKDNGFSDVEIEDEEWGERRLSYDEIFLDFYFEEDTLVGVSWGIFEEEDFEDDDIEDDDI